MPRNIGIIGISHTGHVAAHVAELHRINTIESVRCDFKLLTSGMAPDRIARLTAGIETASKILAMNRERIKDSVIIVTDRFSASMQEASLNMSRFANKAEEFKNDCPELQMSEKTRKRIERERSGKNSHRNHFAKRGRS